MTNTMIKAETVDFVYKSGYEGLPSKKALTEINIRIEKGLFVAVIGRNGSGKSTFARLLNALLLPVKGVVYVKGIDTKDHEHLWDIRHTCGMAFQNPDNQIIGTTVEEDVAFGPENLGVPPEEIRNRVDSSLEMVGISELSKHAPHLLSGGQKQRVAIAGILAMKPECIVLDEATAMLDPVGRREVIKVLKKLNREEKITVVHITHHMDEVTSADRVIVIDRGNIILDGSPREVFRNVEKVKGLGLDVPQVTELFFGLRNDGFDLPGDILSVDEAFDFLAGMISGKKD